MSDRPDCAIDYARWHSLPAGVAPKELPQAQLEIYFQGLGLKTALYYCKSGGGYDYDPLLWRSSDASDVVRFRTRTSGTRTLVLPRSSHVAGTVDAALPVADFDARVAPWNVAAGVAAGDGADVVAQKTARVLLWDADARLAGNLPMPLLTDESVLFSWHAPSAAAPQSTAIAGLLNNDDTMSLTAPHTHLLTSAGNAWTGEFSRTLLRAPTFGRVRFQRYRHVLQSGAALELAHPSAAGRIVIRVPPVSLATPSPATEHPTDSEMFLVLEHVSAASAIRYLAALLVHQLLQFEHVFKHPNLSDRGDSRTWMREQFAALFRAWIAYGEHVKPQAGMTHAVYAPFRGAVATPSRTRVEAAVQHIRADAARLGEMVQFIRTVYLPILCGTPADHVAVAPFGRTPHPALICFAGCPVGEPAPAYMVSPPANRAAIEPHDFVATGFTTFDVEAMHALGIAQATFSRPAIAAPAPAERHRQIPLQDFTSHVVGEFAVLRCSEPRSPLKDYGRLQGVAAREFLAMVTKGLTRREYVPNTVDPAPYFESGSSLDRRHPLRSVLDWDAFKAAQTLRSASDTAHASTIGAKTLAKASLDWWTDRSGMYHPVNDTWPAVLINPDPLTGSNFLSAPTPRLPYKRASNVPGASVCDAKTTTGGFDCFDFEAVLKASQAVRNARTYMPIEPAVILAVMEKEGYRTALGEHRRGGWEPSGFVRGDFSHLRGLRRVLARQIWVVFPFGLDILNYYPGGMPPTKPTAAYLAAAEKEFDDVVAELTKPLVGGNPATSILDAAKLPTALVRDYLEEALEAAWPAGASAPMRRRVLSRRTQWVGLALQAALFEWNHHLISQKIANPYGAAAAFVGADEYSTSPPPIPGADANSRERRDFVAYYSLIYLAFNTSSRSWNPWVTSAKARKAVSDTVSSFLALYNHTAKPAVITPVVTALGSADWAAGQRGNMLRFAAALDAYLRLNPATGAVDTRNPADRNLAGSHWQLAP